VYRLPVDLITKPLSKTAVLKGRKIRKKMIPKKNRLNLFLRRYGEKLSSQEKSDALNPPFNSFP
jgi:hypothetical protein